MNTLDFFDVEVRSMTREATGILSLTLHHPLGEPLPPWKPGAHLDLLLPNGKLRQYSLCSQPTDPYWRIAVLHENESRGGSEFIHQELRPGSKIQVRQARNTFTLGPAKEYLFIAGGIGITPILPMVREVADSGAPWRLLYLGRTRPAMAFLDEIPADANVIVYARDGGERYPLAELLEEAKDLQAHVYVCGPAGLLDDVQSLTRNWHRDRLHYERFAADTTTAPPAAVAEGSFEVELSDGALVEVPAGTSILEALEEAGRAPLSSCREGICGTCETQVISGEIEHRDTLLSDAERAAGDTMMICVSRCRSKRLVLNI
ncbi:PDR/VanB family oxidoreductase [Arthrobacter sp. NyZ413]|uniref:PDR/VanB family oxidoreductase n=1 Tax=Arthrobacter sp. NyZ413 TaxID=3144669 RepID=UPI003BF867E7